MLAKLNTALLLLAVGLLLFIATKPTPAPIIQGRFQPVAGRVNIALDTERGEICRTAGKVNLLDEALERDKNPFDNIVEETNARLKVKTVLIHCRLLLEEE